MIKPTQNLSARRLVCWLSVALCTLIVGCASPSAPVFTPFPDPPSWPSAPRQPRIVYVGQLSKSENLKPPTDIFASLGHAMFGKPTVSGVLSPFAICTDNADRFFVADTGSQRIHVFNLQKREYQQWKPGDRDLFTQPVGVAWDPAGRLIVSDSVAGCLFCFNYDGKYIGKIGSDVLRKPAGLVIDRVSRRIFVCDLAAHQVLVLSSDGQLISRLGRRGTGPGEFNFPTNLAIDSKGNLFVADALNFRVQEFDSQLNFVQSIGTPGNRPGYFGQPKGIALDSEDHLYVVDNRQENVQLFDGEGQLLLFFGGEGNTPGKFWLPCGICIDSHNRIWIADTYNKRIEVFDYLPEKQP